MPQPNIAFIRWELRKFWALYALIRDCLDGEVSVKAAGRRYLPMPNAADQSPENLARYKAYVERAVFYNATKRTLAGLCGQVFLRDPVVEVPTNLDLVIADATGSKVSVEQLAKRALQYTLGYGRGGLLADYPAVDGPATREQLVNGDIRPTVSLYSPWQILNWRTIQRGARQILSLVVLAERYTLSDDGFEMKLANQWRVLSLDEAGQYKVDLWQDVSPINASNIDQIPKLTRNQTSAKLTQTIYPKDVNGNALTEIPFIFFGAENNDDMPDYPPLYDLASINIAHYRNSADYEEASFIVGQPTPYFAGLTEEWVKDVLKGTVSLGARGAVPLPEGGSAGLLQVQPNTMPFEAMEHKERQMIALGAKLVEQKQVQRTATEAVIENTSENSTLSSSAKNVSAAFVDALKWCMRFVGGDEGKIKFELNTEFDLSKMTADERRQLIAEWQAGAIAFPEMRAALRKSGIAELDDDKAKALIEQELANAPQLEQPGGGNMPNKGDKKNNQGGQ